MIVPYPMLPPGISASDPFLILLNKTKLHTLCGRDSILISRLQSAARESVHDPAGYKKYLSPARKPDHSR